MARNKVVNRNLKIEAIQEYLVSGKISKAADIAGTSINNVWNWLRESDPEILETAIKRAESILLSKLLSAIEPHIENIKNSLKVEATTARESAEIIQKLAKVMTDFKEFNRQMLKDKLEELKTMQKDKKIEIVIQDAGEESSEDKAAEETA